ncbi:MAG: archease [Planctomycetota bacterium]
MVEVRGRSKELLFINTAYAVAGIMYNIEKVTSQVKRILRFNGDGLEDMFKSFVRNLILVVCKDHFLYKKINVSLKKSANEVVVKLWGEPIDKNKHELFKEIKALTEHQFSLDKKGRIRYAKFVVDV